MSFSVDVNVLLYASDTSSPLHEVAKEFVGACAQGKEVFCLTWLTLMSYLRISTHSRIFRQPLAPEIAVANVEALLSLPHVRALGEDDGFWSTYREVTGGIIVRANLVPDAHLVTLLRCHGVDRLYSHDRDFRKFEGIRVINPFDAGSR